MHALEEEGRTPSRTPRGKSPVEAAAEAAGFDVWDTGGGLTAWGRSLREEDVTDARTGNRDVMSLGIMITSDGGSSHEGDPDAPEWEVGIDFHAPGGDETLEYTEGLTLTQALEAAAGMASRADELWERCAVPTEEATAPRP